MTFLAGVKDSLFPPFAENGSQLGTFLDVSSLQKRVGMSHPHWSLPGPRCGMRLLGPAGAEGPLRDTVWQQRWSLCTRNSRKGQPEPAQPEQSQLDLGELDDTRNKRTLAEQRSSLGLPVEVLSQDSVRGTDASKTNSHSSQSASAGCRSYVYRRLKTPSGYGHLSNVFLEVLVSKQC